MILAMGQISRARESCSGCFPSPRITEIGKAHQRSSQNPREETDTNEELGARTRLRRRPHLMQAILSFAESTYQNRLD